MDAALGQAWRTLMLNHPHDSICGCSIDQVHREMGPRFDTVEQLATTIAADAARAATRPEAEPRLWVHNPAGVAFDGWVEVDVLWPRTADAAGPAAIALLGEDGAPLPIIVRAPTEDTEVFRAEIDFNPDWFPVRRHRLAVWVALPATGGLVLRAVNADDVLIPQREPGVTVSDTILQNEHLALRVNIVKCEWVGGTSSNLTDRTRSGDLRGNRELWISEKANLATLFRDLHDTPRE
jgi:hypothetical protein